MLRYFPDRISSPQNQARAKYRIYNVYSLFSYNNIKFPELKSIYVPVTIVKVQRSVYLVAQLLIPKLIPYASMADVICAFYWRFSYRKCTKCRNSDGCGNAISMPASLKWDAVEDKTYVKSLSEDTKQGLLFILFSKLRFHHLFKFKCRWDKTKLSMKCYWIQTKY